MTPELAALAASVLVHLAAVMWSQQALNGDIGKDGNVGTRENLETRISPRTARLRRALANHVENTGLFIIAVVLVQMTGSSSWLTATAAWVYVAARALYLPAYAFGWVPWRSLIFTAGLLATLLMIVASLI
mgnify:CR=1 FL=1